MVKVTIAIPTFKRVELLAKAVRSALGQVDVIGDFEVLVVDNDPSSIGSMVLPEDVRQNVRYEVNKKNLGMVGNWNRCIEIAHGEYVTILHDDDELAPHFLASITPLIDSGCQIVCCLCATAAEAPRCWPRLGSRRSLDARDLLFSNLSPAPGIVFKRRAALELGGFDPLYYPAADLEFWIRMTSRYKAIRLGQALALYRISEVQATRTVTMEIKQQAVRARRKLIKANVPCEFAGCILEWYSTKLLEGVYARDMSSDMSSKFADRLMLWTMRGMIHLVWRVDHSLQQTVIL